MSENKARGPVMGGHRSRAMNSGEKAKDFKGAMKRLLKYMERYKIRFVLMFLFAIAGTIFNIVGPKILGKATTELFNGLVAKVNGTGSIDFEKIGYILLWTLGLYLASACFSFIQGYVMTGISNDVTYNLRKDISKKFSRLPMNYYESRTNGEILSRVTNDVDTLQMSLNQSITQLITSVTTLIGVFVMMLSINVWMTLAALLILPLSMLIINFVMKHSQKYFQAQQKYLGEVNGQIEENYGGHNVVKVFNKEEDVVAEFEKDNQKLYESAWKSQFFSGIMMPVMQFVGNLGYVMVALLGGWFTIKGSIEVGDIQSFFQYIRNFTQPIQQIAQVTNLLQSSAAASERVFEFLDEEEEETTKENAVSIDGLSGNVEFDHVSFAYPEAGENVITDISFKAEKGETVAIIGSTGSGKSTLINLIPRFYDATEGSVKVDGVDVRKMTQKDVRDRIGYVPQKGVLFSGTIDSNIRYGKTEISEDAVKKAAEVAQATEFIDTKPERYKTPIAQGGSNVSGGQKQRLSIARAIAKDPEIFIFDDSFSALDFKTDSTLRKALKEHTKEATTIIVAQRISTILNADKILVLDDGHMAGIGSHKELMKSCEVYRQIAMSQLSEEELA